MDGGDCDEGYKTGKQLVVQRQRRLKRKSEEEYTTDKDFGDKSPADDRLKHKPRKCSRRLPSGEHDHCLKYVDEEQNTPCDTTKPLHPKSVNVRSLAQDHNKQNQKRKPLVPHLNCLNEDRASENSGFIHSPRAEKPYKCQSCTKEFKYFSNLKSHVKLIHKKIIDSSPKESFKSMQCGGQVFQCEVCFRDFKYPGNLRTHRRVHTGSELATVDLS